MDRASIRGRLRDEMIADALRRLRSGNAIDIGEGEMILIRMCGYSTAGCACPEFPAVRSATCYAHPYITESVILAETGIDLRRARMTGIVERRIQEADA